MNDKQSILLVDDDEVLRTRLGRALQERGIRVYQAASFEEAAEIVKHTTPQRAVLDLKMEGRGGLELIEHLKRTNADCEIIILTGYGSIATAIEAIRRGALHYLQKPADADEILSAFEQQNSKPSPVTKEFVAPSLARAEWEHINRVLADCNGNISEAARRLGMHRRSLQRKLQKYPPNS